MKFSTDNGGFATSCNDIKLFCGSSTWNTRLSQIGKTKGSLIIMTYGFRTKKPNGDEEFDYSYLKKIFDKKSDNVFIICNSDSLEDAKIIKELYPNIRIRHNEKINANIALVEPQTVLFSSENFGYSSYADFGIGFHSKEIYENLINIFRSYWQKSKEI